MLFAIGFLVTFLFGGLTGVLLASPPIDFHVTDTYFVVAHFHYVVFGTAVFGGFGGVYFWFPKMTGRMLNERLGELHFWTLFIGFQVTFLVQHWLGTQGHAATVCGLRRLGRVHDAEYRSRPSGRSFLACPRCRSSTTSWHSYRHGERAVGDDPWGYGNSLEWATSCPPPRHNFVVAAADPVRAAGLRSALSAGRRADRGAADGRGEAQMKVEGYLFSAHRGLPRPFARSSTGSCPKDPTGTTALGISVGLGAMIGGYCLLTARRMAPRPCDRPDAGDRGRGRRHRALQPAQLLPLPDRRQRHADVVRRSSTARG